MVDRVGQGGSLAREAILAAMREQSRASEQVLRQARQVLDAAAPGASGPRGAALPPGPPGPSGPPGPPALRDPAAIGTRPGERPEPARAGGFGQELNQGLRDIVGRVASTEELPRELLSGQVEGFHELVAQVKSAEISFRFALEVRNKLIDAYREIMRMSV